MKPTASLFKLNLRAKSRSNVSSALRKSVQPTTPARTRFAPSPTGFLHLGSLRTALYNYLLARSTGGQFLLRLEDTDQKRLVPGAEDNIYASLKWANLVPDESPLKGGPFGPYRQSDRMAIYNKYAQILLLNGYAYKCYCSKDRLDHLRDSARALKPPTTVSYDRRCLSGESKDVDHGYTIRFRSPDVYAPFHDLLHGTLDLQPQINHQDRRYDDFVIMKLDGLPTYHFANVVDDHLMKITHVIRGEEWLASTPKHVALYNAFGWTPPQFVHIPLLTSLEEKKLSKRQGDMGVLSLKDSGILPEALTNFCALFGWAPTRPEKGKATSEVMTLQELERSFSLDNLTKGNAKVNDTKLYFFNKAHLNRRIADTRLLDQLVDDEFPDFHNATGCSKDIFKQALQCVGPSLSSVKELGETHFYLFRDIDLENAKLPNDAGVVADILSVLLQVQSKDMPFPVDSVMERMPSLKKKDVYEATRYALSGGVPGLTIPVLVSVIGWEKYVDRLVAAVAKLRPAERSEA